MALKLPKRHRAGDTFKWAVLVDDYPATAWTMTLTIVNPRQKYTITGTASGDIHQLDATTAQTALWLSGRYRVVAQVSNGTEQYSLEAGDFEILPDLINETDTRHHVEKVLEALEAMLENKATSDQAELSFNGRTLKHMDPGDILTWRDKYKKELKRIKQQEAIAKGESQAGLHKVRFR